MGAKNQGADATKGRWLTIPRTLSFVLNGDAILLMKRAPTKRVFPNQYNGLGGHIERDEDPLTGAKREIEEESGLQVHSVKLVGVHNIDAGDETGIMLLVFTAISDSRETASDEREGTLHWIPTNDLDKYDLVEDIPLILPRILSMGATDAPYFAHVSYDDTDTIQIKFVTN